MIVGLLRKLGLMPPLYNPSYLAHCDHYRLIDEASCFHGISRRDVKTAFDEYQALHEKKQYAAVFGESKTLCFEEAFLFFVILKFYKVKNVVEIGTQNGKSTRRILDMIAHLGAECTVTCFDLYDEVKYFTPDEAQLRLHDVTQSFKEDVLDAYHPEILFLDARPHALLDSVIRGVVKSSECMLAIHDCTSGICNPKMQLDRSDPNISSATGVWERHVLADVFDVTDPLSRQLTDMRKGNRHLHIFNTRHGLAIIKPEEAGNR